MKFQKGATLIVALVLLAIVTLVGAAGIRGTSLEMKMIASARDRAMAFEAAEATLRQAEANLIKSGRPSQGENGEVQAPTLTLANLASKFTSGCTNGQCFKGSFDQIEPYKTCQLFADNDTAAFWKDQTKYTSATVKVAPGENDSAASTVTTQYLVEFMCFTIKERSLKGTIDDKEAGDADLIYMPLFRITAVAEGLGKRAKVMAQSMVKVNIE